MKKDGKKEVEELKQKVQELEEKYKRALADYQNLEKRVLEDRKQWIIMANKDLILKILPAIDTLTMASKHNQDEGLVLSLKQLLDILKSEGLEKIETTGEKFNPQTMECMETDEGEEGKVLEEIRVGYLLNGNLLRPALVKVGKQKVEKEEEELIGKELLKGDYM